MSVNTPVITLNQELEVAKSRAAVLAETLVQDSKLLGMFSRFQIWGLRARNRAPPYTLRACSGLLSFSSGLLTLGSG